MKTFFYPRGRRARDGVIADFIHCFGGPDREYLGLKKELKTKASISLHLSTNV